MMDCCNKVFSLFRIDGVILSENIFLKEDYIVQGAESLQVEKWKIDNYQLVFQNLNAQIKIVFSTSMKLNEQLIYFGNSDSQPEGTSYCLLEKKINETVRFQDFLTQLEDRLGEHSQNSLNQLGYRLEQQFHGLHSDVFSVSRQVARIEKNSHNIKVLFLIHNVASWDSLVTIYEVMNKDNQFEVIIATIPRCFPGENEFGHEEENHNFFERKHIPHIRFQNPDYENNLQILRYINPHAIFRQSPWDPDIPGEYSTRSLFFTNLFYVPYYGFNLVKQGTSDPNERDFQSDSDFHRSCAQIFCESALVKNIMCRKSASGGDNFVITGHPKLEKLLESANNPEWPIIQDSSSQVTRIIWAPHHSFTGSGWLSFGLFKEVYQDMLAWVKSDPSIEVVLKPHPALFSSLIGNHCISQQELDSFMKEWSGLPNTKIVEGGDYGSLMAASDLMLTDGISFLAEYLIFWEKPLLFLRNKNHSPFNEMGELVETATYIVETVHEVQVLVKDLFQEDYDLVKRQIRKQAFQQLMPFKAGAAERIVESIKSFFDLKGSSDF